MARLTDTLLTNKAMARGKTHYMLNPLYGGQHGFGPDLRQWVNNAAYVQNHTFCLLLEAPRFLRFMDDQDQYVGSIRAMMELHTRSIEGLASGLKVETASTPVGGAGEEQEEVVDVKRDVSKPVHVLHEKAGRPFQNLLETWITYGMMDPATKVANVGALAGNRPTDMLPDEYTATCLYIEPDRTHRKVAKAWLCTNMFPKGTGDITGKRDLTSAMSLLELNVEFSAITQVGLGVDTMAQKLMDAINVTNANPNLRAAFIDSIHADVQKIKQGYQPQINEFSSTAIQAA